MILSWLGIRMTGAFYHTGMFSDLASNPYNYETALFLNITQIIFITACILAVVLEIQERDEERFTLFNNIAFGCALLVMLATFVRMMVSHGYFKILLTALGLG
jgi:hypothetical protein